MMQEIIFKVKGNNIQKKIARNKNFAQAYCHMPCRSQHSKENSKCVGGVEPYATLSKRQHSKENSKTTGPHVPRYRPSTDNIQKKIARSVGVLGLSSLG